MKNLLGTIVGLVVLFMCLRGVVDYVVARDLLEHANACHAELNVKERIHRALSAAEIDALYDEWKTCLQRKSNVVDRWFGRKLGDEMIEAMREARKHDGARRGE